MFLYLFYKWGRQLSVQYMWGLPDNLAPWVGYDIVAKGSYGCTIISPPLFPPLYNGQTAITDTPSPPLVRYNES